MRSGLRQEVATNAFTQLMRVRSRSFGPKTGLPVQRQYLAPQGQKVAVPPAQGANRRPAGAVKHSQHGPLGGNGGMGGRMIERGDQFRKPRIAVPDRQSNGALRRSGHELIGIENGRSPMRLAQPVEACQRQKRRISHTIEQFLQPRMHIAAKGHDPEIGPNAQRLCGPPDRRCSEARTIRKIVDTLDRYRQEGIAHILTLEEGGEHHAIRQARRHVLA